MGCSGSKTDDLPLVIRCRERRELIRAAANHRYALAAAHVSYFRSLRDVGDALRRFIDEEFVATSASPSPPPITQSFSSEINGGESLHLHDDDEEEDSHLCISDSSSDDDGDFEDNIHRHDVEREKSSFNFSGKVYYMKKSAPPAMKTVVSTPPRRGYSNSYWNPAAGYGGDEYFTVDSARKTPPPPSPLGYLNVFDVFDDGGCVGLYSSGDCEFPLNSSSFDSIEVREREGIPDLEDDTEHELLYRESLKEKNTNSPKSRTIKNSSKSVPLRKNERRLRSEPLHKQNSSRSVLSWEGGDEGKKSPILSEKPSVSAPHSERKSRIEKSPKGDKGLADETPRSAVLKGVREGSMKKKGVHSELERRSSGNGGSSRLSGVTELSPHGARDIRDVVAEVRDDFEMASGYGKEVAMMLEAGKMPYQPSFLKAILSRILYLTEPWLTIMDSSPIPSVIASRSVKLAKSYFEDVGKEFGAKVGSLSSTLDKLCAWETKLYKEVKDEEKLRMMYEEQRRRLKILEGVEAESAEVSSIRLLTKLDVCIKAIDVISRRIQKLRDEELQPKIIALIQGMIRMWKAMHRCHQKQFQAISKTKMQNLRVKTGSQTSTITKLENELRAWHHHFTNWITLQKSYVESLNGWLLQFHHFDLQAAPHGLAPYSPGQLGAPPVFVICNDWHRAMEAISDRRLSNAMNSFASSLQNLWGKQDEEERQRLKAEHVSKNYEKMLRTHRVERQRMKTVGLSKMDLDSWRQRLAEERRKHKEATKLVQNTASTSLQGGLVNIFKELDNFTLKAMEAHQRIRLQHPVLH